MKTTFQGETFDHLSYQEAALPFRGPVTCTKCMFRWCYVGSRVKDIRKRPLVENATLKNCRTVNGGVGPALVRDCVVDGLRTAGPLFCRGTCFERVTLRGRIGTLIIDDCAVPSENLQDPVNLAFWKDNLDRYASMDWALDISEAEFSEFTCRSVPAHLIRTDPKRQFVVNYKATKEAWDQGLLKDLPQEFALTLGIKLGSRKETGLDFVVCLPPKNVKYRMEKEGISVLKKKGLVIR